jgi:hypothetical protein
MAQNNVMSDKYLYENNHSYIICVQMDAPTDR